MSFDWLARNLPLFSVSDSWKWLQTGCLEPFISLNTGNYEWYKHTEFNIILLSFHF